MFFKVNVMCRNYISNSWCCSRLTTIIFLILLKNISTIGYHVVDTHRLAKRMDLESCLGQFDVHRNTIIRTGESQAIGGKYLQGLELNTLEECRRLCCETDGCDVYIFEEKNDGYCYLFQCGSPENFHCKFTRHANYTSAVLTPIVRHPTMELTTPKPITHGPTLLNISQQERELTNLKVRPDNTNKIITISPKILFSDVMPTAVEPALPPAILPIAESPTSVLNNSTCGRFQFKCHSGECIAVYNACDGIPQCEDGSDEGPECSGAGSVKFPSPVNDELPQSPSIAVNAITSVKQQIHQQHPQVGQNVPPQYQQQQRQLNQQPVDGAGITPPLVNNREDPNAWANRKIIDGQQTETITGGGGVVGGDDRNGRIFSHKGGIQVPTNSIVQFPNPNLQPIYAPIPRGIYLQPAADAQTSFRSQKILQPQLPPHIMIPGNVNWPQVPQGPQLQGPAYIINGQQSQLIQPVQHSMLINPNANQIAAATSPEAQSSVVQKNQSTTNSTFVTKVSEARETEIDRKAETTSNEEYEDYTEKSTKPPRKKQRKHKKAKSKSEENKKQSENDDKLVPIELTKLDPPVREQYKMIRANLDEEYRHHDGHSDRPSGAVLSLTLGLLVTAALAILVGCRLRTVRRRARRLGGKTPFAQEADFLVNGMYL